MRNFFASAVIAATASAEEASNAFFGYGHAAPHHGGFHGFADAHHGAAPHYQDFWGHDSHHDVHAAPHHAAPHHEFGHADAHHAAHPSHDFYAAPHHVES